MCQTIKGANTKLNSTMPSNLRSVFVFLLERISSGTFLCSLDAALYKLIIDWLMNVRPRPSTADLTHVEHDRIVSSFHSLVHCGKQLHVYNNKLQTAIKHTTTRGSASADKLRETLGQLKSNQMLHRRMQNLIWKCLQQVNNLKGHLTSSELPLFDRPNITCY